MAGVALAVYAGGSLVAGLVYGVVAARLAGRAVRRLRGLLRLRRPAALRRRLLVSLVAAGFVAGLAIAPVLVSGMSLVESAGPRAGAHRGAYLGGHLRAHPGRDCRGSALAGAAVDALGCRDRVVVPALSAALAGVSSPATDRCPARGADQFRRTKSSAKSTDSR